MELISDVQSEIGESSTESVDLSYHLTSAESCKTIADLRQHLLEARYSADLILRNINIVGF